MKRKIAVISLVIMMVAVGVGYAAYQYGDTLDVQGTAASATFDVRFVSTTQDNTNVKVAVMSQPTSGDPADKIRVTATELRPDTVYTAKVIVKNVGSIDAKIDLPFSISTASGNADDNYNYLSVLPTPSELSSLVLKPAEEKEIAVSFQLDASKLPVGEGINSPLTGSFEMTVKFTEAIPS